MMKKLAILTAFVSCVCCGAVAQAGPYTDDLSKCLVKSTTPDDQIVFMQWLFAAMALHPAVSGLASITPEQRVAFDKKAAILLVRLVGTDCRQQMIDAVKYEGAVAFQTSFGLFGSAAMRGLMTDAHVAEGLNQYRTYLRQDENWISVLRSVGLPPPESK
jgi:hypothetical protein